MRQARQSTGASWRAVHGPRKGADQNAMARLAERIEGRQLPSSPDRGGRIAVLEPPGRQPFPDIACDVPQAPAFAVTAVAVPAAMAVALLLAASAIAVPVYRRLGLAALTRFWINLDLGWAVVFIATGALGLAM